MNENGHNYPRQINPVLCLDLADAVPHVRFEVAVPGPKKKNKTPSAAFSWSDGQGPLPNAVKIS